MFGIDQQFSNSVFLEQLQPKFCYNPLLLFLMGVKDQLFGGKEGKFCADVLGTHLLILKILCQGMLHVAVISDALEKVMFDSLTHLRLFKE